MKEDFVTCRVEMGKRDKVRDSSSKKMGKVSICLDITETDPL